MRALIPQAGGGRGAEGGLGEGEVSEGGAAGLSLVGVPPNGRCISKCAGEW